MTRIFYSLFLSLILVLAWGSSTIVKGESFKIIQDTINVSSSADTWEFVGYNHVVNLTDETLNMTWERIENNIPTEWETAVCDNILCHNADVDKAQFQLEPRDTGNIDVHFRPSEVSGEGEVKIALYETSTGHGAESIIAIFNGEATPTTFLSDNIQRTRINFYPNPVDEFLNITFSQPGNYKVEIYNVLGRNVIDKDVRNSNYTRIYFDNFPKGVYLLTVKNEETGERITKRFSSE